MKNFKIKNKLLITFTAILLFFIAAAITAIVSLQSIGENFAFFYERPYKMTNVVMEMRCAIQAAGKNIGYAIMTEDLGKTKGYIDQCQTELNVIKTGLDTLYVGFSGDKQLIDEFKKTMDSSISFKEKVYTYATKGDNENAKATYFNEYMPLLIKATDQLNAISGVSKTNADNAYISSTKAKTTAFFLLVAIIVATLSVTVVLAFYLTKSLTRPILEIESVADQIAGGNLDISIQYQSKDELGNLSNSMRRLTDTVKGIISDVGMVLASLGDGDFTVNSNAPELYIGNFRQVLSSMHLIINRLTETLSQIGQSSDQVSGGADQVASGAQALSQGATEQASSIEELSATITELSGQVKQNAQNAQNARIQSEESGKEVQTSNQSMQEMILAMNDINGKSAEIGKIIKTIEDIAFQTNILALNAAVEAARAGAAGKGFAVVADEVRNLAGKSATAAKNTTALIEETINAVDNGTRIADKTAKAMLGVVVGTQNVTDLIVEIADASNNQANAITQVTAGLDQISAVVQTNSATAEESAAASEELSGQAQMLKEAVSKFTWRQDYTQTAGLSQSPALPQMRQNQNYAASTDKY